MPDGIKPSEENAKIAEAVWRTHYMIACAEDANICSGGTRVYKTSQRLLLATIRQVYGLSALKGERVYVMLIECGESVAYCVDYVQTNR